MDTLASTKTVFGFVFGNKLTGHTQLILACAPDLGIARSNARQTIAISSNPLEWNECLMSSIQVPAYEAPKVLQEITPEHKPEDIPVLSFVYSLRYVSDTFADKPAEKRMLSQIINKIEKKYAIKS